LKPLRNDKELGKAEKVLHELLDIGKLSKDERDYLDVLGTLVEKYETGQHPIGDVTEAEMLMHLIESKGVNQRILAEGAGIPESTISDLLADRRDFNRGHIEKLAAYFRISPAVFFKTDKTVDA